MYINGEFMRAMMWGFCCRKPSEGQYSYGPRQQAQLQRRSRCVSGCFSRSGLAHYVMTGASRTGLAHYVMAGSSRSGLAHYVTQPDASLLSACSVLFLLLYVARILCQQCIASLKHGRGYVKFINKNKNVWSFMSIEFKSWFAQSSTTFKI